MPHKTIKSLEEELSYRIDNLTNEKRKDINILVRDIENIKNIINNFEELRKMTKKDYWIISSVFGIVLGIGIIVGMVI